MKKLKFFIISFGALLMVSSAIAQNPVMTFYSLGDRVSMGDTLYFAAENAISGSELWRTDGSAEGTYMIREIRPGYYGSSPANFTVYGNEIYFTADDGLHGRELWKTDGTYEGTKMFMNLRADTDLYDKGSNPHDLIELNGLLVFAAADTLFGSNLWKTDGNPGHTSRFFTSDYTSISKLTPSTDRFYFKKNSGPQEMWQSDGTPTGTSIITADDFYSVEPVISINGIFFCLTYTSYKQTIRLYSLRAGESEFTLLKEFKGSDQNIANFTEVNNMLYFSVSAESPSDHYKDELWRTDGTGEGTILVKSFGWDRYYSDSQIRDFINFNGTLYFNGGSTTGNTLWKSDGTLIGTKKVCDKGMGNNSNMVATGDHIFFSSGTELWRSDGTTDGTKLLFSLETGHYGMQLLKRVGEIVYFQIHGDYQHTLWNSTPKPDIQIKNGWSGLIPGGTITFPGTSVDEMYSSDLTITNKGLDELFISEISLSGKSFFTDAGPCMIEPGKSRAFKLNFFPESAGTQTEMLTIYSNDNNQSCFSIHVTGISAEALQEDLFSGSSVDFKSKGSLQDLDTLILTGNQISEHAAEGSVIGIFSVKDDQSEYTFSLVSGVGDADNEYFTIADNTLISGSSFDHDRQTTHVIRVKADNKTGRSIEKNFLIRVIDEQEPLVCGKELYNLGYALNDVAVNSSNEVFAVGYQGMILHSKDGNTWQTINSGTKEDLTQIQFVSANTAYILGQSNIFKTENSGQSWFPVSAYPSVCMHFISENTGFIADHSGNIYNTSDGGLNWNKIRSGFSDYITSIYFINNEKGFICGRYGFLSMTTDGGKTWTNINLESLGWSLWLTDISFGDENNGYILCEDGMVLVSVDGGITWSNSTRVSTDFGENIQFVNKYTGYITGGWLWGNVYKTTDAGKTWESLLSTPGSPSGIGMNASGSKIYIVGNASGYGSSSNSGHFIYRSLNSGQTWTNPSILDGDTDFHNVKFFNDGTGYLFGGSDYGGSVAYKTTDHGLTWKTMLLSSSWKIQRCSYLNRDTIFAVGDSIYLTTDGGATWNTVQEHNYANYYSFISVDTIFAATQQEIYKTTDRGLNWQLIYKGDDWYYSITFKDQMNGTITGYDKIETTKNGGVTWKVFDHHLERLFRTVYYAGGDTILIGGQEGAILKSTDNGETWKTISTIIPVEIISLDFVNCLFGYAVASNLGGWARMYSTSDGGETWTELAIAENDLNNLSVSENGDVYLAGDYGDFYRYSERTPPAQAGFIKSVDAYCPGETIVLSSPKLYNTSLDWKIEGNCTYSVTNGVAVVKTDSTGPINIKVVPYNGCGHGISREITILPSNISPTAIVGKDTVNAGEQDVLYMPDNESLRNLWHIEGSRYAEVYHPGTISVDWGSGSSGEVELIQTNDAGCRTKATKPVYILSGTNSSDELDDLQMSVYPNPAKEWLYLVFPGHKENIYQVTLLDERGVPYLNETVNGPKAILNIADLPKGIYTVLIITGNKAARYKVAKN